MDDLDVSTTSVCAILRETCPALGSVCLTWAQDFQVCRYTSISGSEITDYVVVKSIAYTCWPSQVKTYVVISAIGLIGSLGPATLPLGGISGSLKMGLGAEGFSTPMALSREPAVGHLEFFEYIQYVLLVLQG